MNTMEWLPARPKEIVIGELQELIAKVKVVLNRSAPGCAEHLYLTQKIKDINNVIEKIQKGE